MHRPWAAEVGVQNEAEEGWPRVVTLVCPTWLSAGPPLGAWRWERVALLFKSWVKMGKYLAFLCLSFPICKKGKILAPAQWAIMEI